MSDAARIEAEALAWRMRRDAPDWCAADEAALEAWISQGTAYRVAWLRIDHGWQRTARLAALSSPAPGHRAVLPAPAAAPVLADLLGRRRQPLRPAPVRRRTRPYGAVAAALCLLLSTGVLTQSAPSPQRGLHVTAVGARAMVPLADGSRLELNTDTRLRAQVHDQQRVAWLDRGEAYFDVAADPERPFVVYAGGRRIVVLGTRFAVRRWGGRVDVVVEEGRVRVETPGAGTAIVSGGAIAVAEAGRTQITEAPQRVERRLAWRQGLLVFERATLAEVAAEFNRYNSRKLQIRDAETAEMRISGHFEATNLDAFARLLRRAYGLRIDEHGDRLAIGG